MIIKYIASEIHDDVLERFYQANQIYKSSHIVRITADDPLLDPSVIDEVVSHHLRHPCDYTSNILNRSWPRGLDTEVFTSELLNYSHFHGLRDEDRSMSQSSLVQTLTLLLSES